MVLNFESRMISSRDGEVGDGVNVDFEGIANAINNYKLFLEKLF